MRFTRARPLRRGPAGARMRCSRSYRSGFWGMARIAERAGARTASCCCAPPSTTGARRSPELARIPISTGGRRAGRRRGAGARRGAARGDLHGDLRARDWSCSGARSTRSARRRTANWVCVISDDCSSPERFAAMRGRRGRRSPLRRSRARRGGCASTTTSSARSRWRPPTADYVAMADQDDFWHPDKLETLLDRDRERPARLQRRPDRPPGRRADLRHLLEPAAQQPLETSPRC